MAIYKGLHKGEFYREIALGKWTHSKANGKTFDSMGSAAGDYMKQHRKNARKRMCFLMIAVISIIGFIYGFFMD